MQLEMIRYNAKQGRKMFKPRRLRECNVHKTCKDDFPLNFQPKWNDIFGCYGIMHA